MYFVDVLLPLPLARSFTYSVSKPLPVGSIVSVPWRSKSLFGLVTKTNIDPTSDPSLEGIQLKSATETSLLFSKENLEFLEKVSSYNLIPPGVALKMMLHSDEKDIEITPPDLSKITLAQLNPDQAHACDQINGSLDQHTFQTFLLDGVTGSGKTEVYFHSVAHALHQQKQVLILIPELGLTSPFIKRFEERFGFKPYVWHSASTPKQKRMAWHAVLSKAPGVFVGARSSLFLPYDNLGLIIVDEEHDSSYKQEEQALYHARDMAILRASITHIPIVLGSATPSLESFANTKLGKSTLLTLSDRHGEAELPKVHLIDRRTHTKGVISTLLIQEIEKRLNRNEQSLLFINRRGYAPLTLCQGCGFRFGCPGCSTSLVLHKKKSQTQLLCHYCGYTQPLPKACPSCSTESLIHYGPGVEKVVEELHQHFPKENIATLTSDMTLKSQRETWEKIYEEKAKIIVGTQLLTKGHHLPKLTLVGVIDGDMGLMGSDLRASERAFQLLQQVGGRAGREDLRGEVFIQTYQTEHPLFHYFQHYDRDGFYDYELNARKMLNLPPYGKLASLIFSSFQSSQASEAARQVVKILRQTEGIQVLGPVEAPIAKLQSRYRYRILLKGEKNVSFGKLLAHTLNRVTIPSSVRTTIDIDPQSFL